MRARAGLPIILAAITFLTAGPGRAAEPSENERLAALPEQDREWLSEYVAPIILPEEKKLFLELTQPREREAFKEEFWKRREKIGLPSPFGPGYRQRYARLREVAATTYDGLQSDAGRMVVRYGEPDQVDDFSDCNAVFRDVEVWSYSGGSGAGAPIRHLFYRPGFGAPRKLWNPALPDTEILQPSACLLTIQEACLRDSSAASAAASQDPACAHAARKTCARGCEIARIAEQIRARSAGANEVTLLMRPPPIPIEGLEKLRDRFAGLATPAAKPLAVEGPGSTPGAGPAPAANPAPDLSRLSKKERIARLPEDDRNWLTQYVAPIILPEEEKVFLDLTEPYQREIFKQEFWKRREKPGLPAPLGPGYQERYEDLRRLADEKYDGWRQDAGRMVLRYGEPASIDTLNGCTDSTGGLTFRDLEIWTYDRVAGSARGTVRYLFYRPTAMAPRRLWTVGTPDSDVFAPGSCRQRFEELAGDCAPRRGDPCAATSCDRACEVFRVWSEIVARQGSAAGGQIEAAKLFEPERVPLEGLEQIKDRFATTRSAGSKTLAVEGPGSQATAPTAAKAAAPSTPAPIRRKLSRKEIKQLTAQLAPKYREFLETVDLIITDEERQVFLQIAEDYQKNQFIEDFWKRRSIDAQGLRTDFKSIYLQRIEAAKDQFKNLRSDRAKVFVINGPPDAVVPIDCPEVFVPLQIWYYERIEALKSKVYLIFYQPMGMGDYKLWLPLDGEYVLQGGGVSGLTPPGRRVDITRCVDWRTVQQAISYETAALGSGAMSMAGESKLFEPPAVETEGIDRILSMTTDVHAGAAPLAVTRLIQFPEERANKIGTDISLLVPKAELKPRQLGDETFYNVDVIGEVVKDDRLIDNFKYRFDFPIDEVGGEKIPLTVRRYLYPGKYKLVLKVSDGNQNAEGRITDVFEVPEQPDAPPPGEAAARAQGRAAVEKVKDTGLLPSAVSLLPIAKEIATGLQRFETRTAQGVRAVDFYLNGTRVLTKTRAPFQADLNLGPLPRKQTIRVVAYGATGRAVGEDEYIVNEGREVFRVRILSPEKGAKASGPTRVTAAVAVPEGKTLQKLEFYSNETRVATLYQPPWEQTVNVRDSKSLGYLRVVGTLGDGTVAEDVRYVNAPSYISEVSVDAVELYTTVAERGRPVTGLQASNFKVYEDGVLQKIQSFEYVKNLPLTLGVMIDTSASMLESLPGAQQAAIAFLDYSIGPKDRAFTVSFDNEPSLLTRMTNRKDRLYRSLAGLRAEGSTALYDAVIYGLYQFSGVKGKKALILLTDGKDTASKFDYDTLLEYVRKSGISIYPIGLNIPVTELDVKYKLNKLAQVTGGQTFYIGSVKNLEPIYRQINDELRSQYLLTYYSSNTGGKEKWRKVEVKVTPSNLQARTLSGYYP